MSLATVARNGRLALSGRTIGPPAVADLRADAWGHGIRAVAGALLDVGVGSLRVDEHGARLLSASGITRFTTTAEPDLDPLTIYGLPGGAPGSRPAMRLTGTVLSTKPLLTGEGVSYGYTHRAPVDTHVALVGGGYAQGIVRSLGNRVAVTYGGSRLPIVGRVAMDVCVVDIADADIRRGDEVVFFGDPRHGDPSLAEWVDATGLTAPELVALVGVRSQREEAR